MVAGILLAVLALVALVVVAVALHRPVLWRMAARNATRRPRRTATVLAGLMIGTAIIASGLVAGDSAGSFIRGAVHESLGHIDETVRVEGFPFFPEDAYEALAADLRVSATFDGVAPTAIWSTAAENPRSGAFEPRVTLVGFEPEADAAFGVFSVAEGSHDGRGLGRDGAIVTKRLADALDLGRGDTMRVAYTLPVDPMDAEVTPLAGRLTGAGTALPGGTDHAVGVAPGSVRITVVLGWDPRPAGAGAALAGVEAEIRDPFGAVVARAGGVAATPPLWLNVTAPPPSTLEPGAWGLRVAGSPGADTPYEGAAVVLRPAYGPGALPEGDPMEHAPEALRPERREADLTVVAVTDGGRGDMFSLGEAAFMRLDSLQGMLDREGEINLVKFSNPGGVADGAQGTDEAMERLQAALADLRATHPHPAVQALEARPVKQELLEAADDAGATFTAFLLFAGSLTVVTGVLLIINIFTMLAAERRSELGVARAVGLGRGALVRLFVLEGSLYAAAAAAVGAAVGVGLAYLMVVGLNVLVAAQAAHYPPVPFVVRWDRVASAFAVGGLLSLATVAATSVRVSRLNVVRAIRRLAEPDRQAHAAQVWAGVPLVALGAALSGAGWLGPSFSLQVFGPLLLALGLGVLLRRFLRRRHIDPPLAALLALYYAWTFFAITEFSDMDEAGVVGPVRGVLMTLSVVVLVTYWEAGPRLAGRLLSRLRRLRAVARPAFNYPQHRKFRTGMTLAMFSIVLLAIGFFSIFGALFDVDPATQAGGFDIEATTTLKVDDLDAYDAGLLPPGLVTDRHHLAHHFSFDRSFITVEGARTGHFGPPGHHVYGYGPGFPEAQAFRLLWRLPAYASDEEAYRAVLQGDDAVIVAYPYSTDERGQGLRHGVGDTLRMHFASGTREFTIVGVQEQAHFTGVFLGKDRVESLFPRTTDMFLIGIDADADAVEAARLLQQNHREAGLHARSIAEEVAKEQQTMRQMLAAMKLFLGLGLVVGVLSLGIVTSRSVMERRQEIGMMRALGYTARQVRAVFVLEVTLTVLLAAAVGLACSIVVTYGLWSTMLQDFQYPYAVPWAEMLAILGVAYLVALAATAAPIRRAARTAPAEAVRYIE